MSIAELIQLYRMRKNSFELESPTSGKIDEMIELPNAIPITRQASKTRRRLVLETRGLFAGVESLDGICTVKRCRLNNYFTIASFRAIYDGA